MKDFKILVMQMLLLISCTCIISSCSKDEYTKAIPANSTALISIDSKDLVKGGDNSFKDKIKGMLGITEIEDCGIDFEQRLYFFETSDGNFGGCLKVDDSDEIESWLDKLKTKRLCSNITNKKETTYALINNSWEIGFTDETLVILGPILPAQQADAIRSISKYLKQDADDSGCSSPLFSKLDSIDSPVSIVTQIDALPEKLSLPFTLGQPKNSDASQIILAAGLKSSSDGNLLINGHTFSFNDETDKALKANLQKFRKIEGTYTNNIPQNSVCSIFMNVDGKDFVTMAHNSPAIGSLLAGINTAIDMDNILRCINGDFAIAINSFSDSNISMTMAAKLANHDFVNDANYWKKSCPSGCTLTDEGKNRYFLKTSDTSFWFGATDTEEFYGSTDKYSANSIFSASKCPYDKSTINTIKGKRLCMIFNITEFLKVNDSNSEMSGLVKSLFGNINKIIYTLE